MQSLARVLGTTLTALATALAGLTLGTPPADAAGPLDGFDPGMIVTDAAFYDSARLSETGVRRFLADQGAQCVSQTGTPCLKDYRVDSPATWGDPYCPGAIAAVRGNDAAGIIHRVGRACGINPEMLVVLIQKESGLVTNRGATLSPELYAKATGVGCPDYQPCDGEFASFFGQVYGAASRFQKYRQNPTGYPYRAGRDNQILYNPEETCGRATVRIRNQATAGLYIYTPYAPNAAAIANPHGEGDLCSAYGNRNFYRLLKAWFPASASPSTAAPIVPQPPSTVTPALTATYARSARLGPARTGPARSPMQCESVSQGPCVKRFSKLSIVWTRARGATLSYADNPILLPRYRDVPAGTAFADEIEWLTATRVASGWPDGTFRPVTPVARDAMAAFLYRAAGSPAYTPPPRATFTDVPVGSQFFKEIEWLASRRITTGWEDGTFRPLGPVNRDAMAAFLYRFKNRPAYTPPTRPSFRDVPVGTQFRAEIEWLARTGVTTGYDDGTYRPRSAVNRDAMAAFLYRLAVV